jgi:hypothetical protein
MKLADLLKTVENSGPEQWHKMDSPTIYGWGEVDEGRYEPKTFETLLVCKEDVDVSLAMAATVNKPFQEPWAEKFPDSSAESVVVALRYRGAIVYEWTCVIVDGGRYLMPMPDRKEKDEFELPKAKLPLARLLCQLHGPKGVHTELDGALQRAGIRVV